LEDNHMAIFLKGNLELVINPEATEAMLEFTPDRDGRTWNREHVITLLKERSVLDGVNPATLENAIRQFAGATQGRHSMVIAQGVKPAPAVDSALVWTDLPLPAALGKTAEQLVQKAPAPRVYDLRPAKTDTRMQAGARRANGGKKADIQYRGVEVSPEVKKIAYAEKGQKIAVFSAPLEGTPGRDIYGRPVLPAAPKRHRFYFSEQITRHGNDLFAAVTGIIRIGANWADIIPYQAGYYRVYTTEDGLDCLFDFSPGAEEEARVSAAGILKQALELGFSPGDLIPESTLHGVITQAEHYKQAVKGYSLCTEIEPLAVITVSEDRLLASLLLRKGRGRGKHLSLKEISGVINGSGLKNLNLDMIRHDILEFYRGGARELTDYTLARGTPPTKGENGEIIWEIPFEGREKLNSLKQVLAEQAGGTAAPESQKDFPIDMVAKIAAVQKDERVAYVRPPDKRHTGQAGRIHPVRTRGALRTVSGYQGGRVP
jgi:hypothetical protein